MSDDQPATQAEGIDLDESGAESVIGDTSSCRNPGADIHLSRVTVPQALEAGYRQVGSASDGDTPMGNVISGKEMLCRQQGSRRLA